MSVVLSLLLLTSSALPQETWSRFGWSSCWVGDADGDGQADLAVSDYSYPGGDGEGSGVVVVLSRKDGALLKVLRRQRGDFQFGRCLGSIGVRGVGGERLLAVSGWRRDAAGTASGFVRILSVQSGEGLVELEEEDGGTGFGELLATSRDVDRDGVLDYAVGAPARDAVGRCYVYSGKDHRLLHRFEVGGAGSHSCAAITLVGDMDGDGSPDIAIGSPGLPDHHENLSAVELRSGISGALIRTLSEPERMRVFGRAIVDLGDINADGRDDLAVGAPAGYSWPKWKEYRPRIRNRHAFREWLPSATARAWGTVYLFSGSDGSVLGTIENEKPVRRTALSTSASYVGDSFGEGMAFVEGCNGSRSVLLIADHMSPIGGVVHGFEIPPGEHRWSLDGVISDFIASDYHLGYQVYSDAVASTAPLFVAGTSNPYGGSDPRIRVLQASDGKELLRVYSSDILPRIQ